MPQLRYDPGPDDPVPYHDTERNSKYYPAVHDVPADAVDEYLDAPGWRKPDADEFDAEEFIDRDWRSVHDAIASGRVDDHLEAIRVAESERSVGAGPRDSVMNAVYDRQGELEREGA